MTKKKPESEKLKVGKKPKYDNPEQMQKIIDKYFEEQEAKNRPFTICGLCRVLGFASRQSLLNYQCKPEFVDTIKKAKLRCEEYQEEQLVIGKNTAGIIFGLKNNYGWIDKVEQEITSNALQVVVADTETKNKIDTLFKDANNG